ncbi:MAG: hypothetical protein WCF85_19695 [Rhodospirillaceae bacterium]
MSEHRHYISGFFANHEDAERTRSQLVEAGLPLDQLHIYKNEPGSPGYSEAAATSDDALKDILVDGAIGTVVGSGLFALAELALVAGNVTLFIASPLIAPLVMLGWGASLGGLVGAAAAATDHAGHKEGRLADLIRDAISSGQTVLLAETRTEHETAQAQDLIQASVGITTNADTAAPKP